MDVQSLGDEPFVQLTSFRRTGEGVGTTVWIARDGMNLYVTTPAGSGKVKRLRNNAKIELRPSSRRGAVDEAAPPTPALAEIRDDEQSLTHAHDLLRRKYGWQFRVAMGLERRLKRDRERVILLITVP